MEAGHPVALIGEHVRSGSVYTVHILAIRPEHPDGFCKGPTGLQGQCHECAKSGVSFELAGEQMGRREARLAPDEKRPGRIFERRFKIAESGRFVFGLETEGNGYAHVCEVVAVAQVGGRRRCWRRQLGPQAVRVWSSLCRSCSVERSGNPLGVAYLAAPDRFGRRIRACPAVADVDRLRFGASPGHWPVIR